MRRLAQYRPVEVVDPIQTAARLHSAIDAIENVLDGREHSLGELYSALYDAYEQLHEAAHALAFVFAPRARR
jgi:hypothetical protein